MKECTLALLCNVTLFPKTLPYFYAIQFLKLNKIEKVFDIKSQIVQLKLNHKPTDAPEHVYVFQRNQEIFP